MPPCVRMLEEPENENKISGVSDEVDVHWSRAILSKRAPEQAVDAIAHILHLWK